MKSLSVCIALTTILFGSGCETTGLAKPGSNAGFAGAASATPLTKRSEFGVHLQVFDATTARRVHKGERVNPGHEYNILVNFTPVYVSGAGQYVLTTASVSDYVSVVQSETFTVCCDSGTYEGPNFSVTPGADWKISATLNGDQHGQFADDSFEFRTK